MQRKFVVSFSSIAMSGVLGGCSIELAQLSANEQGCLPTLRSARPVEGAPWSDELHPSRGWYGSSRLAAHLPSDGKWRGMVGRD